MKMFVGRFIMRLVLDRIRMRLFGVRIIYGFDHGCTNHNEVVNDRPLMS